MNLAAQEIMCEPLFITGWFIDISCYFLDCLIVGRSGICYVETYARFLRDSWPQKLRLLDLIHIKDKC